MLKELLISIVSGVVVAVLLQIFHIGGSSGSSNAPRQTMYNAAPPARRRGGGFFRFVFAIIGGLGLAYVAAPFVLEALHGGRGGGYGRGRYFDSGYYDRGGGDGLFGLPPLLVLTIIGTIIIWVLLSALRRR
jgi:hypothetical protein